MTSKSDHAFNIKLIEKRRTYDWAFFAAMRFMIEETSVFVHRDNPKAIMPLSFIVQQSIQFNKAEALVLDCINRKWWFKDAA